MSKATTTIRYRLLTDDAGKWFVQWRCGSSWLPVYGPASEPQAREWMGEMIAYPL